MNLDRWNRIEEIFGDALELDAPHRPAFVTARCGNDADLKEEVLRLLQSHAEAGDYLENRAIDFLSETYAQYRATREIGRGGMSVVFLGERIQKDFDRQAAIKILLGPTGPMAASETRILAGLEHPNIARLFDAGTTSGGFRYLVMEYIDGVPIDAYCRGKSQAEILRLFLQVCEGVQHANRALIVHRDLKPGNILVTPDGTPKLLDFGIAKLVSSAASDAHTTGIRAWTPDYASPEQILGQTVTMATDVYSLGVVLCELLTGQRPRQMRELPLADMVELARASEIGALPVSGELGLILSKALRRDPAERYESASAFKADLERYLSGHPIEARPPSRAYAISKFVARHKPAVAATTIALLALVGTAAVAIWQERRATQRFEQVRNLSKVVLFELYGSIASTPGTLPARRLLAQRGLEYLDALSKDPRADNALLLELAQGYHQLALIEGGQGMPNLGNTKGALDRLAQSRELLRTLLARDSENLPARILLVDVLTMQASVLATRRPPDPAIPIVQEAMQTATANIARKPGDLTLERARDKAEQILAIIYQKRKETMDQSIAILERLIPPAEARLRLEPANRERIRDLMTLHRLLSFNYSLKNDWQAVSRHVDQDYSLSKARLDGGDLTARPDVAYALGSLSAVVRHTTKDPLQSIRYSEQQLALRREMAAAEPANVQMKNGIAFSLSSLATEYAKVQRFPEALAAAEEALRVHRALSAADPQNADILRDVLESTAGLAYVHHRKGDTPRACSTAREAQALLDGPLKDRAIETAQMDWLKTRLADCPR